MEFKSGVFGVVSLLISITFIGLLLSGNIWSPNVTNLSNSSIVNEDETNDETITEEVTEEEVMEQNYPYVGMSVKFIDQTGLGAHDNESYNYENISGGGKHRCTLYYWMDGDSCICLVRADDVTGKVILVEDYPEGSFFGNPID